MTVGKAGSRRPVATGCGAAPAKPSKPAGRTPVATGCGSSAPTTGWKPKAGTVAKGKTGLSERSTSQLEKAKTTRGGKTTTVSTGCGSSSPAKPSKPATPAKPVRTGC